MTELLKRTLVALVGIPIAIAAIYAGGWILAGLILLASVLAAQEFYRMAARKPAMPFGVAGAALSAAFVLAAALEPGAGPAHAGSVLALGMLALGAAAIWLRGVEGEPLLSLSTSFAGAAYTGLLLSFGIFLRHLPGTQSALHGTLLVLAPVVLTWVSDTFAYLVGRRWGTRKLIPRVSPGKTVQGAVGALVGSVLVGVGYAYVLSGYPTYRMSLVEGAVFGALVSVAAQVGDLVESLLKRDADVKDSGTLLPGHGGALDRLDSLLFTLPLAYYFLRLVVGA